VGWTPRDSSGTMFLYLLPRWYRQIAATVASTNAMQKNEMRPTAQLGKESLSEVVDVAVSMQVEVSHEASPSV
jgi:hypothetical protein